MTTVNCGATQKNLERNITYEFIVPSNRVDEFRRYVRSEFSQVANGANGHSRTKLSIGCMEQEQFKSLAVTHYRILISDDKKIVLFEAPIGLRGYWVNTEGEAIDGFLSRFENMKEAAKFKQISEMDDAIESRSEE